MLEEWVTVVGKKCAKAKNNVEIGVVVSCFGACNFGECGLEVTGGAVCDELWCEPNKQVYQSKD